MSQPNGRIYEFGHFRLDAAEHVLRRDGEAVAVPPKAFALLLVLVERHGHLLEKEELLKLTWPDTFVEEANLSYNISLLRKALGDGEDGQRFIETVPKRGYRFVGKVREEGNKGVELTLPSQTGADLADGIWSSVSRAEPEAVPAVSGVAAQAQMVSFRKKGLTLALAVMVILLSVIVGGLYKLVAPSQSQPPNSPAEPRVIPITSRPGYETDAAFSPDGNQVAFVAEGDIYLALIGAGVPLQRTATPARESDPVWSPDGHYLAFFRHGEGGGVYLIPTLSGHERRLAEAFPQRVPNNLNLSFSPDGKLIAVVDKGAAEEPFSIFLILVETGEKWRLTLPPGGSIGDYSPAFSPDGSTLAFARKPSLDVSDIYVVPVTGGEPGRLTHENTNTFGLTWTSDGRSIIFSSRGKNGFRPHLWRIPAAGGTPERVSIYAQDLHQPAISRQGSRLAYTQAIFEVNIWRLGLTESTGKVLVPSELVHSTEIDTSPSYSSDGKRIAFTSARTGMPEIWVCDSSGDNQDRLTDLSSSSTGTPCWSPDDTQIAFESSPEGNKDIYLVSAGGGKPRRLTTEPSEDQCPSWSRDGRWVYFGSNRSGSLQIWKMPSAGGPAVQVTKEGGFEGFESPDGKFFYYTKGLRIPGIWRVPVEDGAESLVLSHNKAGSWRYWAVVKQGIYFATWELGEKAIEFFNFTTGKIIRVATLDKGIQSGYRGLSVSPDGRWLIYASIDQSGSDIMLMENFH